MDQNELLQKPRLGRCLERGYTLPPGTTFGHANYKQDGGTGTSLNLGNQPNHSHDHLLKRP